MLPFHDHIGVADLQSVRIFDNDGVQMGATVPISGVADVKVIDRSTLITDDNRTILLNADGVMTGARSPVLGSIRARREDSCSHHSLAASIFLLWTDETFQA